MIVSGCRVAIQDSTTSSNLRASRFRDCADTGTFSSGYSYLSSPGCFSRPTTYNLGVVQPGVYFDVTVYVANKEQGPQEHAPLYFLMCTCMALCERQPKATASSSSDSRVGTRRPITPIASRRAIVGFSCCVCHGAAASAPQQISVAQYLSPGIQVDVTSSNYTLAYGLLPGKTPYLLVTYPLSGTGSTQSFPSHCQWHYFSIELRVWYHDVEMPLVFTIRRQMIGTAPGTLVA